MTDKFDVVKQSVMNNALLFQIGFPDQLIDLNYQERALLPQFCDSRTFPARHLLKIIGETMFSLLSDYSKQHGTAIWQLRNFQDLQPSFIDFP